MASDDDNSVQLPAYPQIFTLRSRLVTIGSFCCIPARVQHPVRSVARDELKKFAEHGWAPHPIYNTAKPGRIAAWNDTRDEESGKSCFKFYLL